MNIDGVRVLAQEAINETPDFVFLIAVILVSCMLGFGLLAITTCKDWVNISFIIISVIEFIWFMVAGVIGIFNKPYGRNTYKCIFDEDVSIQEIYDEYEVVGRDGEIWILEDKE